MLMIHAEEATDPAALDIFVSWGGAALILFGIISSLFAFAVFVSKTLDKRIAVIAQQLDDRTKPIQSDANGGLSLPDVARNIDILMDRQNGIGREIRDLRTANDAHHELLGARVDKVAHRLDEHAQSPVHDRRRGDAPDNPRRRRTD
jgi:hypothetical protein